MTRTPAMTAPLPARRAIPSGPPFAGPGLARPKATSGIRNRRQR